MHVMHIAHLLNRFLLAADQGATATDHVLQQLLGAVVFSVIGLLEDLDSFAERMAHVFGRRPLFLRSNKNPAKSATRRIPDENSEFHRRLLDLLAADIEIYRHVKGAVSQS